jgi:hypothetical protein
MHDMLTQRATHLRPPVSATPTESGATELSRADYAVLGTNVPFRLGMNGGLLRSSEFGDVAQATCTGSTDAKRDVKERDVFEVGPHAYLVTFVGNRGYYLMQFALARVVLR